MFKQSSVGLKYLFLLILLAFVAGSIRTEVILHYIGPEYKNVVRTSAYISLFIGGLFSFVIILFAFYITTLIQPANYKSEVVPYFTYGIQYFAIVMIIVELAKIALVFIFLKNELSDMDLRELQKQLQLTTWYKIQTIFNGVAIVAGAYVFADTVRKKSGAAQGINGLLLLVLPPAVLLTIAMFVQF